MKGGAGACRILNQWYGWLNPKLHTITNDTGLHKKIHMHTRSISCEMVCAAYTRMLCIRASHERYYDVGLFCTYIGLFCILRMLCIRASAIRIYSATQCNTAQHIERDGMRGISVYVYVCVVKCVCVCLVCITHPHPYPHPFTPGAMGW